MGSVSVIGTHSPRLKAARRLGKRAFRDRERAFLAEGPQAVAEAHAYHAAITDLFVTASARTRHADLVDAVAGKGVPLHLVNDAVMGELAQTVTPQGLLAVCQFIDVPLKQAITARSRLVAILANVRDPGNAGTVLRTADAAGADAVIFADASVDPYNGKCVRATAGSLFHLPVTTGANLKDVIRRAHENGLTVLAADGNTGHSLDDTDLTRPTAWLFGNEAWGLPKELRDQADQTVAVPIYGKAESLNLATAAAVCLYASARVHAAQRLPPVTTERNRTR